MSYAVTAYTKLNNLQQYKHGPLSNTSGRNDNCSKCATKPHHFHYVCTSLKRTAVITLATVHSGRHTATAYPSVRLSVHAIHFLTLMRVSLQERLYQSGCCLEADSCGPKEACIRLGCTFSPPGKHVGMTFATAGRDAGCHHHYCNNLFQVSCGRLSWPSISS